MPKQPNNKINWMSHNIVPIVFILLSWAASFGVLNTKVDQLIKVTDDMRVEIREWRKQYEQRLGQTEVRLAVLENK